MKKTLYVLTCALCTLLVLPAAAQVPSYVPTDGLVGWWPFNGNANDESGNGNDGVVNGATLTEDRNGIIDKAYNFNGSSNIEIPHSNSLNISSSMSFSIWFKQGDLATNSVNYMIQKGSGGGCSNLGFYIGIDYNFGLLPNGSKVFNYGQNSYCAGIESDPPLNNDWHSLIFVYEPNVNNFMYLDGVLIQSGFSNNCSSCIINNVTTPLRIGGYYSTPGGYNWNGLIDDIAIYNRALTEQEIHNLYTGTTPPPCVSLPSNLQQGLVGYWPFCGNANDESGNGNDGEVNGATLTEDRFGNANAAYAFNGVDNHIDLGNVEYVNEGTPGEFSVSMWVAMNEFNSLENGSQSVLFGDEISQNNGTLFQIHSEYGFGSYAAGTNGSYCNCFPELNTWVNYTIVQTNAGQNLYINGEPWGLLGEIQNSEVSNAIRLGLFTGCSGACSRPLDGSLDDIGIWNRALTPEEVQELYTLDACTFTVYDTLTVYETVYDTVYTYETIYDTVTTYVTVTDTLLIDITFTGFEGQPSWLNTVTVFPNPASDHITIDYGNFALMAGYNTIITDAAGATVYSSAVNSQQVEIDINAWGATGVYYMSIYDANGELVAVRHIVLE